MFAVWILLFILTDADEVMADRESSVAVLGLSNKEAMFMFMFMLWFVNGMA